MSLCVLDTVLPEQNIGISRKQRRKFREFLYNGINNILPDREFLYNGINNILPDMPYRYILNIILK